MRRAIIGSRLIKGRGALGNPAGRFEIARLESVDDGWFAEEEPASIVTSLEPDRARNLITSNNSPDVPFERSINPYRGCEHGCIYCYARPSHGYMGLSAGLDFETRLFYKADAAKVLEAELSRPGYLCKPITLGANTDPYQPVERRLQITRTILQVLARCRHPVTLITKGALVARDLDLLVDLARDDLTGVAISITSLDAEMKRTLEPRAASPQARLRVMRLLADAGVPVGVMVAPIIPVLTDHELESILEAAANSGASWAGYVPLRLPYEVKDLFRDWLTEHHPQRAAHVMAQIREMRGGRDNDPRFGMRMRGTGPVADLLHDRFRIAVRRLGLGRSRACAQNVALFRAPEAKHGSGQLSLGW